MNVDVELPNIKTVTVRLRQRGNYTHGSVTLPPDLISREQLVDGEDIVIAFLQKANSKKKDTDQS